MPTLYDIAKEHQDIMLAVTDENGEITEEKMEALMANDENFDAKVESCCMFHRNLESDVDAIAAEIKRLSDRKKVAQNKAAKMKDYLARMMKMANKTEAGGVLKAKVMKGRESVDITDPEKIPDAFVRVERKPMKTDIGKALKAGEEIPGAALVRGADTVKIK